MYCEYQYISNQLSIVLQIHFNQKPKRVIFLHQFTPILYMIHIQEYDECFKNFSNDKPIPKLKKYKKYPFPRYPLYNLSC